MNHRLSPFDALLLGSLILLIVLLAGPVLTIPLHIPINYNEGWNAGFDTRAVFFGRGPLYPGRDSFVFNNYPPLGFFIVGGAGRFLFGDMIVAGRVIALMALLASAALVGICVRNSGASRRSAGAAALLLLLFSATFYRGYVAMDDPQWLAHAMMVGGLAVLLPRQGVDLLRAGRLPWLRIALACVLMVAGGFIKHNLVALPVATTFWLLWLRPRAALIWITCAMGAVALGLVTLQIAFGHAAFVDIFQHRRVFRVHLLTHAISRLAPLLPAGLVLCLALRRRTAGDGAVLVALFAAIALVTGTLQRMGEGVYYNSHFETMIAVCLGVGLVLDAVTRTPLQWRQRQIGPSALFLVAILPILGALPWHLPIAWDTVANRHAREKAWQPMIARLAAAHGLVGCHLLSVCYWAGKPFTVDLFNLTQSALAGGSIDRFQATVARRDFVLFEDDPNSFLHSDAIRKLGYDPVMAGFRRDYVVVATGPDGVTLLAPRGRR